MGFNFCPKGCRILELFRRGESLHRLIGRRGPHCLRPRPDCENRCQALSSRRDKQEAAMRLIHRGVEFDVEEVSPSNWRWKIIRPALFQPNVVSEAMYPNLAEAINACSNKINRE